MLKYKKYFKISANGLLATCNEKNCNAIIKCPNRTTSGMKYHIEEKHKIKLNDDSQDQEPNEKKAKTNSIMSNFVQIKKPPVEELLSREACQGKILA